MPRNLTAREVAGLSRPGHHRVSRSLYVQITPTGTRSWLFRYTSAATAHWMGLGPLDLVTLAEARAKVLACRRALLDGDDPLTRRRAEKARQQMAATKAMTFAECAQRYIAAHQASWKNGKHRAQWTSTLTTYAYPVIGRLPVAVIDTDLIMRILEPIWATKPETAGRVRGRIETVLDWAAARNLRSGDNPARWRGHLQRLLPARAKVAPIKHFPALSYVEMPAFMATLRQHAGVPARCLEFTILTASRTGAAIGALWSEIDLKAKAWVVPPERLKGRSTPHTVPLSEQALAILRAMPRSGDLVFEGARAGRPISDMGMTMLLRRMGHVDITVHGFRSAFKDWAAEQTSYPNEVSEMALAHVVGDKVEAAYRRGHLLQKRRLLMRDWARYCTPAPGARG